MVDKRIAGTLFIDMKYVSLYHKLGYKEKESDVYSKCYPKCKITIFSEEQKYVFENTEYSLKSHSDFVILELLDLLLVKGYNPGNIQISGNNLQIIGDKNITIYCEQWGRDYHNKVEKRKLKEMEVIYTSRLSGGLIERRYVFCCNGVIHDSGLLENEKLFDFTPVKKIDDKTYPKDFIVESGVFVRYLGNDEEVLLPDGIWKIDTGSFWNNMTIKKIKIPNSVKVIGGDAFAYCNNLEKVNISKNVCDIGDNPFAGCNKLNLINESNDFILEDGVLFTKDKKRLIHYTPWLQQEYYTIPESVEWIGKHSFYNCDNLKEISIGKNVDFIGNNPFSDCHNVILKNNSPFFVYKDGALLNKDMTTIFHYSHGRDADEYKVPDTVRTIGRNSFWNCKRIKKIVFGENLRQIGYNPFANCSNLKIESNSPYYLIENGILYDRTMRELMCCTDAVAKSSMIIPNTVENIGRSSFAGCTSLKNIEISNSVRTISRGAFSNSGLESVRIPDSVILVEKWAFSYCPFLKNVYLTKDSKIENEAFVGSDNVKVIYE